MSAEKDDGAEKSEEATELLGTGTWIRQGPATLVLRENAWVVLVPGLRKQVTEAAWTVLGDKPAPEDFLDRLVEAGQLGSADKLTAILFGFHDGADAVFGVKGTTPIAVYTADGSQQIAGTEEEPFVLTTLHGVRRVAFGDLPAEESIGAPRLSAGIVPVRGFVHVTMDPAALADADRAALAEQIEADGRSIEDPEAKKRRAARPAPAPKPASSSAAPSKLTPALATRKSGEMPPSLSRGGARSSASSRGAAAAPEPTGPNRFADLFGDSAPAAKSTEGRSTAPPAEPSTPPAPAPVEPAAPAPSSSADAPDPEPSPADAPAPAPSPSASSTAAVPAPAAPTPAAPSTAAAPSGAGEQESTSAGKRPLVSTSLFDRRRRSAPKVANPAPTEPAPTEPAPTAPVAETAAPATAAAPTSPAAPAAPTTPSVSVPTPEPPPEEELESPVTRIEPVDDDLLSPETQIAPIDEDDEQESDPAAAPRRAPAAPRRRASAPPVSELENTGAYDDLFGKTVFRRIEDAAVRRTEEDAEEQGEPEHASTSTTDHPGQEAPAPRAATGTVPSAETVAEPEPEESSAPSEFIDWVPGVGRTAPEIAQTAARRASAPRPAESAYPQVHMAERPPAPNTGSRPAPVRPATPNGQAGPLPQHGAPMMSGAAGQHVGYSAQAPSAPPQPHRPMDPGAAGAQVGYPGPHGAHPPHSGGPPHGAPPQAGPPARPLSPHHGQHPAPSTAGPGTPGALALPGLVCGNGHANSPERAVCRVCHAPLQGPTRTVARPPLGTIWTSYGERVVLDRTAILGRRPRASRVSAQDVPQLITVPSPQQDISRSHLELRLEGWHVVAIDLGTTNGTTLHRAGFDPARLRAREGVVLRDGDALDLGDGVHLRYGEKA